MVNASDAFRGDPISEEVRVLVLVVGWLTCASGTLGNVLVITTLLTQPSLRSLHNLYIGNLAIADLIIAIYVIPNWLLGFSLGRHPVRNVAHCFINAYITGWAFGTSILTLVTISVNRYLHVCHTALFLTVFTKQRTLMLCALTWVLGCLLCLPNLLTMNPKAKGYDPKVRVCFFNDNRRGGYSAAFLFTMLVLPSIIVGFCNVAIFCHWRSSRQRILKWQTRSQPTSRSDADVVQLSYHHRGENGVGQQADKDRQSARCDTANCNTCLIKNDQPANGMCIASSSINVDHLTGSADSSATYLCDSRQIAVKNHSDTVSTVDNLKEHQQTEGTVPAGVNAHIESVSHLLSTEQSNADKPQNESGSPTKPSVSLILPEHPDSLPDQPVTSASQHHHHRLSPSDRSLILSLSIVFVCCVVLYLPSAMITLLNVCHVPISAECQVWVLACGLTNHSINWVIYGLKNRNFRDGYRRQLIFCFKKCSLKS